MLTKNHYKLIRSLRQKKQRQKQKLFVAEGVKVVQEDGLIELLTIKLIFMENKGRH